MSQRRDPDTGPRTAESPGSPGKPAEQPLPVRRRSFIEQVGRDLVSLAGSVAGLSAALFNPEPALPASAASPADADRPWAGEGPFRWSGDCLLVVDQSHLPWRLVEHECRTAADVADLIRQRAVDGGPLLGQLAACGLALDASRLRRTTLLMWPDMLAGARNSLVAAGHASAHVRAVGVRMIGAYLQAREAGRDLRGDHLADTLHAEAITICAEISAAEQEAGRLLAGLVPDGPPEVRLLVPGGLDRLGPDEEGLVASLSRTLIAAGRQVRLFVPESRPLLGGTRLIAWELARYGIPHSLLVDAAIGHLLMAGSIDAVILRADCLASNGDIGAALGSYGAAVIAARHGVPVYAAASEMAVDPTRASGSEIGGGWSSVHDTLRVMGRAVAPPTSDAFAPLVDVVPAELVTAVVTARSPRATRESDGIQDGEG